MPVAATQKTALGLTHRKRLCCHSVRTILLVVLDILNDIANSLDVLNLILGDLNVELILDAHNEVNNVKGISAEVISDIGSLLDGVLLYIKTV